MSDLSEIYKKNVTPGPDSFITHFDAELEIFLRDIFENPSPTEPKELEFFLNDARNKGLIEKSIDNIKIINMCVPLPLFERKFIPKNMTIVKELQEKF